ncbi:MULTISPECIES: AAA family ATPase [unclassified Halomonas]|uniref:AAA family ATPase n=1 Tax=unclassified Halomonas TaxID=2609666 RepID=UPI001EF488F5|nr:MULTISPECIES: AAA family ATPase [unclassified Halomonas]MCG7576202.1 ATP-binding protein [Halomonas sp. MMH1-48]MCG7603018.1 ATP-binding protein [Halomonas sp. MM17-34]MCG7612268.1 ATP-binding protein [Halomonas sp. MM17-29]MCG7619149.1 ATP-binding protein [Halomonas sp. DSH1-27]
MLKRLELDNFTLFPQARLDFAPGLNVIVGENGTGKSHLLKVAYSVIANAYEQANEPSVADPTKTLLQKGLADKLIKVFRPESLGRLASRRQGAQTCKVSVAFQQPALDTAFNFSTRSQSEVKVDRLPSAWQEKAPVFMPTRELLSQYHWLLPLYENRHVDIEEHHIDLCKLLGAPAIKGPREKVVAELVAPLEEAMGGKVVLDKNGRFYLRMPSQGNLEMPLVAEGLRKLAMLARLVITGSLLDKGCLFWDEPEANLNPKLIKLVARAAVALSEQGIQVVIATHSLFLLKELELLARATKSPKTQQRYFALIKRPEGVEVEQGSQVDDLQTLVLLDEELAQSDRYLELA